MIAESRILSPSSIEGVAASIAKGIVDLVQEHGGTAPAEVQAHVTSDLAVVKLVDCVTVTERQLVDAGHEQLVMPARDLLVRAMRADATAIVEQFTGREVIAYLTHHDPDLTLIVFDLAASRPDGAQGFRDAPSIPQSS